MVFGGLGPAIASYIVYKIEHSKVIFKDFVKHIFANTWEKNTLIIFGAFTFWRVFMIWLAFGIDRPISILGVILNLPFLIVLGGLEELGWRGFLQPKLEQASNYYLSILFVGLFWGLWHIPLWFIPGTVHCGLPFMLYLLSGFVLTSSFTTLFKYTNSLFLTILSHAWFNGFIGFALYTASDGTQKIDISFKAILIFGFEFLVSTILSIYLNYRKRKLHEITK